MARAALAAGLFREPAAARGDFADLGRRPGERAFPARRASMAGRIPCHQARARHRRGEKGLQRSSTRA
jgi:hypothetical protein